MKPSVLLATQDQALQQRLQAQVGDLCTVEVSATPHTAYEALMHKPFSLVLLDVTMPRLDPLGLLHALRHAPGETPVVVMCGTLDPSITLATANLCMPVPARRSLASLVNVVRARLDPSGARKIQAVRYQPKEDTFFVVFQNGNTYELSRKVIEEDDGSVIVGEPGVVDGGEAFRVRQKTGKTYDVPWDFVLYHHEPTYPYHKGKASQKQAEARRAQRIAKRILQARQERRWTLRELADRTGIKPPNLARLEAGVHVPSLGTLERVAAALGMRIANLVAP